MAAFPSRNTSPTRQVAAPARVPEDARRAPAAAPLFDESQQPEPPAATEAARVPGPASTLTEAYTRLSRPFAQRVIEVKPGALTKDKARALAMPYADLRVYQHRLDSVVGPEGWSPSYQMSARGVVCALTILGVTKSAIGDYPADASDENAATSAEAQSFKRACSAFGLGRYLYRLPQVWGDYDDQKRQFKDPAALVWQMYQALPKEEE